MTWRALSMRPYPTVGSCTVEVCPQALHVTSDRSNPVKARCIGHLHDSTPAANDSPAPPPRLPRDPPDAARNRPGDILPDPPPDKLIPGDILPPPLPTTLPPPPLPPPPLLPPSTGHPSNNPRLLDSTSPPATPPPPPPPPPSSLRSRSVGVRLVCTAATKDRKNSCASCCPYLARCSDDQGLTLVNVELNLSNSRTHL
jgi:hypothetical protein